MSVTLLTNEAEPAAPQRSRLVDIDRVKAIAIVLVVYGHIVAREPPSGNRWYEVSKLVLYLFHMPLFMFVSGLLMAYAYRPPSSGSDYVRFVSRRAARLLPAYLILALVVVFGKLLAKRIMHVDNAPSDPSALLLVITRPYESAAAFLWYVYVLLLYAVTFPLWLMAVRRRVGLLLPIGLALFAFVPRTDAFGLGQYTEYFVFFALGVIAANDVDRLRSIAQRWFPAWALFFATGLAAAAYQMQGGYPAEMQGRIWMLTLGVAAIMACLGLVRIIGFGSHTILDGLAKYTFTIYLFNTLAIGLFKGILTKAVSWDGLNFLFYLPALWLVGLTAPILLHRTVLARLPRLGRITI